MHIPESIFLAARHEPQVWEDDRGFVYLIERSSPQEEPLAVAVSRPDGFTENDDWPDELVG